MTRLPIKQALLHQSIRINNKEESVLGSQAHVKTSSRVNYQLWWHGQELWIEYEDGEFDILPIGNIKKMAVDREKLKSLTAKADEGMECRLPSLDKLSKKSSRKSTPTSKS